nr:steroid C27-monooxygenase [Micromonospora sp. DSM 115978]
MSTLGIDVFDPDCYANGAPYADLARLRAEAPVYRHPDPQVPEGHWAVTRHADVVHVSRHPEIFSSYERLAMPTEHDEWGVTMQRLMMLNIDPPDHTRLRRLVNRGFTPRTIGRLTDRVVAACEQIIDAAVANGTGDFVTMVSAELPLIMIAELMGIPVEDRARLFEWSNRMVGSDDPGFEGLDDGQAAAMEMMVFAHEIGADKRANPVDDIVTKLVSADDDGHMLTEDEFDAFFIMLVVAGNETTRNSMTGGILALIENPDQWARLKANPDLASTAAEEVVRWATPVKVFRRTALEDVELGGQSIKAG